MTRVKTPRSRAVAAPRILHRPAAATMTSNGRPPVIAISKGRRDRAATPRKAELTETNGR
ncbi:hypothetical protein GCM10010404_27500 [Nonomuraea africana]